MQLGAPTGHKLSIIGELEGEDCCFTAVGWLGHVSCATRHDTAVHPRRRRLHARAVEPLVGLARRRLDLEPVGVMRRLVVAVVLHLPREVARRHPRPSPHLVPPRWRRPPLSVARVADVERRRADEPQPRLQLASLT